MTLAIYIRTSSFPCIDVLFTSAAKWASGVSTFKSRQLQIFTISTDIHAHEFVYVLYTSTQYIRRASACAPFTNLYSEASDSKLGIFYSGSRSNKTFKPKKNIPEGTHQYDLMRHAAATLGSGNLRVAVMLPEGEDLNEWVAVNSQCQHFITFL